MFIDLVLVLGLQIFMGNTGILWFPHVGFMGIGAYVAALCSMEPMQKTLSLQHLYPFLADIHMPFVPALLVGALTAATVAAVVGLPLMRLSDFPVVITSFALLVIIYVVLTHWNAVTNGPQTFFGVDPLTHLEDAAAWACLTVLVACLFRESRVGLQLRASRDDLVSARSIGIDVVAVRWTALVISAFVAGLGGGLFAHFITSFTPKAFFLTQTFVVLAMLVIGGPSTVTGAVLGTVVVTVIYQSLRWVENTINMMQVFSGNIAGLTDTALSIILILVLILRPGGLVERDEVSLPRLRMRLRRPAAG
ncbi:MAG: branched-chain amino acid ABC transporter permease [Rhodospirillaceae bacterium]|nr:branched-chain amino acid ABC transporter permease [Rhodospirillaceae bacterium]